VLWRLYYIVRSGIGTEERERLSSKLVRADLRVRRGVDSE
jgi:hypothetical protein